MCVCVCEGVGVVLCVKQGREEGGRKEVKKNSLDDWMIKNSSTTGHHLDINPDKHTGPKVRVISHIVTGF